MTRHNLALQRGFTLIELVMVIVILGVLGGIVAVWMKGPIDAYLALGRRAALTNVADTTVRRIARDLRTALPNSVRTPNANCMEFIPTKTGGRYRADDTAAGLNFAAADTTFNMLGSNAALPADQRMVANDVVVVYNLGITGADAYSQNNTAVISSLGTEVAVAPGTGLETPITIASTLFPLASGSNRFHVVPGAERIVAYVCNTGTGELRRTVSAAFSASPICLATGPVIANNVSSCAFNYGGSDLQRNALVSMSMQVTNSGETVSLQHEVHVNNTP